MKDQKTIPPGQNRPRRRPRYPASARIAGREQPLSEVERKAIVAIKLYQKNEREGPTWSWIRSTLGLSYGAGNDLLYTLGAKGLIWYGLKPHSTFATKLGVRRALEKS